MQERYYYKVAGFVFQVSLPVEADVECLLPSFHDFRILDIQNEEVLFQFTTTDDECRAEDVLCVIEEGNNDMGHTTLQQTRNGYRLELTYTNGEYLHIMQADKEFKCVHASMQWNDRYAGSALCSLIRIAYAQAILACEAISVHASAVVHKDRAFLFMGKSGTGKSTHAALWQRCFADCFLLNDDNPTLRIEENGLVAYGTPWSGKTSCYKNLSYPVQAVVRLRQAKENSFKEMQDIEAFVAILPGCSVISKDETLYDNLCDTLIKMTGLTRVGMLDCLPNEDAAHLCATSLI